MKVVDRHNLKDSETRYVNILEQGFWIFETFQKFKNQYFCFILIFTQSLVLLLKKKKNINSLEQL